MAEFRFTVLLNAANIRLIMSRRNVTHMEIARDLSTTAVYWSMVLNGKKGVSPRMGKRITTHPVFRGRKWDDLFTMRDHEGI